MRWTTDQQIAVARHLSEQPGPETAAQIAAGAGVCEDTARNILNDFAAEKLVSVLRYRRPWRFQLVHRIVAVEKIVRIFGPRDGAACVNETMAKLQDADPSGR